MNWGQIRFSSFSPRELGSDSIFIILSPDDAGFPHRHASVAQQLFDLYDRRCSIVEHTGDEDGVGVCRAEDIECV